MDEGVLFEAESHIKFVVDVFASEVDSDSSDWDWLLRRGEGELYHEPELLC